MDQEMVQTILTLLRKGSTVELKIEHGQIAVIEIQRKLRGAYTKEELTK